MWGVAGADGLTPSLSKGGGEVNISTEAAMQVNVRFREATKRSLLPHPPFYHFALFAFEQPAQGNLRRP